MALASRQSHDQSINKLGLVDSPQHVLNFCVFIHVIDITPIIIKRPLRDACLCMGDLQAPPAPHFVFLITL